MYGFATRLVLTEGARRGWFRSPVWVLVEPLVYYKKNGEIVNIPRGFVTDLASIPKWLHFLIGPAGPYSKAAVLHDYLLSIGEKPEEADDSFLEAMLLDSVPIWLATKMFQAVRTFGKHNQQKAPDNEHKSILDID